MTVKAVNRSLILALWAGLLFSFPQAGQQTATGTAPSSTAHGKKTTKAFPSSQEIAEAKAHGMVWVNSATRVYHKSGPLYGTTKLGKFMTEEDAKKAGYRVASEGNSSKHSGETK